MYKKKKKKTTCEKGCETACGELFNFGNGLGRRERGRNGERTLHSTAHWKSLL